MSSKCFFMFFISFILLIFGIYVYALNLYIGYSYIAVFLGFYGCIYELDLFCGVNYEIL